MSFNQTLLSSTKFLFIAILGLGSSSSMAALVETALPSNAYITLNGFDWAWGSNCSRKPAAGGCDTIDAAFQMSLGWRIAEASDMGLAPIALDFLFTGANVPFNGVDPVSGATFSNPVIAYSAAANAAYTNAASAGACASSYFTLGDGDNACDWLNGSGNDVNTIGWYNQNGSIDFYADVLFIRDTSFVPVPAAVWLFGSGLVGLIGVARRKKS